MCTDLWTLLKESGERGFPLYFDNGSIRHSLYDKMIHHFLYIIIQKNIEIKSIKLYTVFVDRFVILQYRIIKFFL